MRVKFRNFHKYSCFFFDNSIYSSPQISAIRNIALIARNRLPGKRKGSRVKRTAILSGALKHVSK